MHPTDLRNQLAHFTGSETFTRQGLVRGMLMTEGAVFLAEAAAAHWLTDAIASHQHDGRARSEEFQVWKLTVNPETRQATLMMTDGNGKDAIIIQRIDYTDFPLEEITLWLVASGGYRVLMLPSEY